MKFEDLKLIFNSSNYIELASDEVIPKTIKNQLIRFDKNNRSNSLLIRTIIDNSTEFNTVSYLCKTINDKDNAIIDKVLYTPYFAKVVFVEKEKIGVDIVRALYGVQTAERANKAIIVTSSCFTEDAQRFAEQQKTLIDLFDIDDLIRLMENSIQNEQGNF